MIVDVTNALFALQPGGEFGHGLNDIDLVGQWDQQPFGNPSDSAYKEESQSSKISTR